MIALLVAILLCPPTSVAFGDSITVGYGARTTKAMWANRVGVGDNRAVAGSTVAEQVEVIRAYRGRATTALWFSCTNDLFRATSPLSYTASLSEGVRLLQARGLTVYVGTCLRLKRSPYAPRGWEELHDAYSAAARAVAEGTGAILVDIDAVYDAETMEASFLPWHPSDAGHAAIAQAFLGALHRRVYVPLLQSPHP